MQNLERIRCAVELLEQLHAILIAENEHNWRLGVEGAIRELRTPTNTEQLSGFDSVKSIYRTMTQGGRGLAEFYVRSIEGNKKLDPIRTELWEIFS